MKKSVKRIISLLLIFLLLLSCVSTGIVFAQNNTTPEHQAIVLVLDTSGSMSGSPITNLKKAALEFCSKILSADPNNQIAVVTFASNTIVNDFTNNLAELDNTISSIYAYGDTYMVDAIKSADKLLQKETAEKEYVKSIVVMADGEPFDTDATIQAATSLFSQYNIYSIGFFEYENEAAKNLLKSIQNSGYYEANNLEELINQFVKIAEELLSPFLISLRHEELSIENDKNPSGKLIYSYKIIAGIQNKNSRAVNNATATLQLGSNMSFAENEIAEKKIGIMQANETKEVSWLVTIALDLFGEDTYSTYIVTASSDNTVPISQQEKIIIDGASEENNELNFSKDTWGFGNYGGPLYLTSEHLDSLLSNLTDSEKREILDDIKKNRNNGEHQGGHCWGMSATVILTKAGIIQPVTLQPKAKTLHELKYQKYGDIDSYITYYQLTCQLDKIKQAANEFEKKTNLEKITYIKDNAEKVKIGNNPLVIWWSRFNIENGEINRDEGSAHAVVGYAYEPGNWVYDGHNFDGRILVYDCNNIDFSDTHCMYVNTETGDWNFPEYEDTNSYSGRGEISLATNDLELLSTKDIDTSTANYRAQLMAQDVTDFLVKTGNKTWKSQDILKGNYSKSEIQRYYLPTGGSSPLNVVLPDNMSDYTVTTMGNYDFSLKYSDTLVSAQSEKADSIAFSRSGNIQLKNSSGKFKLSSTVENHPLSWFTVSVSGRDVKDINLIKEANGYIVTGDNLHNITVEVSDEHSSKNMIFDTDKDSVLIHEENGELIASVSQGNDGVYETKISSSNNKPASAKLFNLQIENVMLNPEFNPDITHYIATVTSNISSVNLIVGLQKNTTATVSVNGEATMPLSSSYTVNLASGKNVIEIVVSGEQLLDTTYTITINRESGQEISSPKTGEKFNIVPVLGTGVFLAAVSVSWLAIRKRKNRNKEF